MNNIKLDKFKHAQLSASLFIHDNCEVIAATEDYDSVMALLEKVGPDDRLALATTIWESLLELHGAHNQLITAIADGFDALGVEYKRVYTLNSEVNAMVTASRAARDNQVADETISRIFTEYLGSEWWEPLGFSARPDGGHTLSMIRRLALAWETYYTNPHAVFFWIQQARLQRILFTYAKSGKLPRLLRQGAIDFGTDALMMEVDEECDDGTRHKDAEAFVWDEDEDYDASILEEARAQIKNRVRG
ncbi:hypothetical protein NCC49_003893 [Naganishia albida]|nr:hypothetical protein NCC49_003893 [Naganishia albida]